MVLEIIPKQDLLKSSCFATGSIYMLNQRSLLCHIFWFSSLKHPFLSDPCKCSSKPFFSLSREREREREKPPIFFYSKALPFLSFEADIKWAVDRNPKDLTYQQFWQHRYPSLPFSMQSVWIKKIGHADSLFFSGRLGREWRGLEFWRGMPGWSRRAWSAKKFSSCGRTQEREGRHSFLNARKKRREEEERLRAIMLGLKETRPLIFGPFCFLLLWKKNPTISPLLQIGTIAANTCQSSPSSNLVLVVYFKWLFTPSSIKK